MWQLGLKKPINTPSNTFPLTGFGGFKSAQCSVYSEFSINTTDWQMTSGKKKAKGWNSDSSILLIVSSLGKSFDKEVKTNGSNEVLVLTKVSFILAASVFD